MMRFRILAVVLLSACSAARSKPVDVVPAPQSEWPALMTQASIEASAGRFGAADKLLTDFTTKYPASGEAVESMYWRALYKLDPSNQTGSPKDAGVLLETYLASPMAPHRIEAQTLRRLASALESRGSQQSTAPRQSTEPAAAGDKAKDDEIARLKDELAKANAELERIKKRLAQPTKP